VGARLEDKEKKMAKERDSCSVCGAELRTEPITYTQPGGELISLVVGVPAQVCPQCGEQYLSPDTVDAIQEVIEQRCEPETIMVPLYHFPHATV